MLENIKIVNPHITSNKIKDRVKRYSFSLLPNKRIYAEVKNSVTMRGITMMDIFFI
tara:strand:- start:899 stop:1066 length:168 start_codon:yes stop_codon:yes gene_type:complete